MNIITALKILNFDKEIKEYSIRDIEKRYKKLALKYHPDKSSNTKEKFLDIYDAKEYIITFLKNQTNTLDSKESILTEIDSLISIYNTCHKCQMMSGDGIGLFGVHFILENIILLIKKKIDLYNDENQIIVLLRPSIRDLMNDNVFVYKTSKSTHYIPLWHREICIYEKESDIEYLFLCIPLIKQRLCIDEKNNIYIFLDYSRQIEIGGKHFEIPSLDDLKTNFHTINNCGVLQQKNTDIFHSSSRANIFIKFTNL